MGPARLHTAAEHTPHSCYEKRNAHISVANFYSLFFFVFVFRRCVSILFWFCREAFILVIFLSLICFVHRCTMSAWNMQGNVKYTPCYLMFNRHVLRRHPSLGRLLISHQQVFSTLANNLAIIWIIFFPPGICLYNSFLFHLGLRISLRDFFFRYWSVWIIVLSLRCARSVEVFHQFFFVLVSVCVPQYIGPCSASSYRITPPSTSAFAFFL